MNISPGENEGDTSVEFTLAMPLSKPEGSVKIVSIGRDPGYQSSFGGIG
jgi:hypothetical protein